METIEDFLNKSNIQYFGIESILVCEPDLIKKREKRERSNSKCITYNTCVKKLIHYNIMNIFFN